MAKFRLIYFNGCPHVQKAREALGELNFKAIEEVCQDDLVPGDPLKGYSSPTILQGEKIIYGSKIDGSKSCSAEKISTDLLQRRMGKAND